jgi:hypothetical protein
MSPPNLKVELGPSLGSAHIVTSGQTIPIKVIFANKQDRPEGIVTVSLGRSQAKIKEGSRLYSRTAALFHLSNTLQEGRLSPGEYEWSFEFILPSGTSGKEKAWAATSPYKVSEGHQLPPSMAFDSVQALAAGEGSVSYKIEAKFSKSPKPSLFSSSESADLDLYYLPFRKLEEPDPQIYFMGSDSSHVNLNFWTQNGLGSPNHSSRDRRLPRLPSRSPCMYQRSSMLVGHYPHLHRTIARPSEFDSSRGPNGDVAFLYGRHHTYRLRTGQIAENRRKPRIIHPRDLDDEGHLRNSAHQSTESLRDHGSSCRGDAIWFEFCNIQHRADMQA